MASWSFLTNHGLVLTFLGGDPESTGLEIARAVGITERAARKIVADLLADGYLERDRVGRRNRYRLDVTLPLQHPGESAVTIGELLDLLWRDQDPRRVSTAEKASPPPLNEAEPRRRGQARGRGANQKKYGDAL